MCKYRPNWYSARMDGDLPPYAPNQQRLLAFEVTTTTEVDISAYQPSLRYTAQVPAQSSFSVWVLTGESHV